MSFDHITNPKDAATAALRKTLRRFGIITEKSFAELIEEAAKQSVENFGTSDSFYMSPAQMQVFRGLSGQIDDENPPN